MQNCKFAKKLQKQCNISDNARSEGFIICLLGAKWGDRKNFYLTVMLIEMLHVLIKWHITRAAFFEASRYNQ